MTGVRDALADYLQLRRRLGFEMPQDGRLLEGFVTFLEAAGAERISTDLALAWARSPGQAHPSYWGQRLTVVRGFARHLATLDPASEVPAQDLLPAHRPRIAPYIYTDDEIAALIAAAGRLTPPLRALRHQTLIGLLAVTAMRPAEALALDRDDVDLRHRTVLVRIGKQHKQREVPLHDSTVTALGEYVRQRDARFPQPTTPAFFISARGGRVGRHELNQTFTKLIRQVGLDGRGSRARPRPLRPPPLGGRRGYVPCRVVVPGEGRVGRVFVRIIPTVGVTAPASRASRSGRCPRSSRAGRPG